jgi:hypothetical protein
MNCVGCLAETVFRPFAIETLLRVASTNVDHDVMLRLPKEPPERIRLIGANVWLNAPRQELSDFVTTSGATIRITYVQTYSGPKLRGMSPSLLK